MRVEFVTREAGPERLLCEAEIVFGPEDGPLAGMKLVGLSVWQGPDGENYVTFPSRAFGAGSERKYFDYLRTADGIPATARNVKAWILAEYAQARAAA
jgi:hypothetical protein